MSKRKDVIRVHDRVRIINPESFVRCGYPLTKQMMKDSMTPEELEAIHTMFKTFGVHTKFAPDWKGLMGDFKMENSALEGVKDLIAGLKLREQGWGGKERKIYTEPLPHLLNAVGTVQSKRTVKTGTYRHGSCYSSYYDGYDDYEPPYLDQVESHVILTVRVYRQGLIFGTDIDIEKCHVQKLVEEPQGQEKLEFA